MPETFWYILYKRQRKPKGQSRNVNPETLVTQGTHDTGRRQTKHKNTENKNGEQSASYNASAMLRDAQLLSLLNYKQYITQPI